MQVKSDVNIEWVYFNGDIVHVSSFAGLRPQDRPEVLCYECMKPVVLKLGNVVAHHAAHVANSCSLSLLDGGGSESVMHFNCKMWIYSQLKTGGIFNGLYRCKHCQKTEIRELCRNWTEVRIERRLNSGLIPDITLVRSSTAIMGIEVLASHAVGAEKAEALAKQGIEWIEVVATKSIATEWRIGQPIPLRYHSRRHDMQCDSCRRINDMRSKKVEKPQKPIVSEAIVKEPVLIEHLYSGKSCVICGEEKIAYASNSGPLCAKCSSQKELADSLGLGWKLWVPNRETALQAIGHHANKTS